MGHIKSFSYFCAKQDQAVPPFCWNHSKYCSFKKSLLTNKGRKTIVSVPHCQISRRCQPRYTIQVLKQGRFWLILPSTSALWLECLSTAVCLNGHLHKIRTCDLKDIQAHYWRQMNLAKKHMQVFRATVPIQCPLPIPLSLLAVSTIAPSSSGMCSQTPNTQEALLRLAWDSQ